MSFSQNCCIGPPHVNAKPTSSLFFGGGGGGGGGITNNGRCMELSHQLAQKCLLSLTLQVLLPPFLQIKLYPPCWLSGVMNSLACSFTSKFLYFITNSGKLLGHLITFYCGNSDIRYANATAVLWLRSEPSTPCTTGIVVFTMLE